MSIVRCSIKIKIRFAQLLCSMLWLLLKLDMTLNIRNVKSILNTNFNVKGFGLLNFSALRSYIFFPLLLQTFKKRNTHGIQHLCSKPARYAHSRVASLLLRRFLLPASQHLQLDNPSFYRLPLNVLQTKQLSQMWPIKATKDKHNIPDMIADNNLGQNQIVAAQQSP